MRWFYVIYPILILYFAIATYGSQNTLSFAFNFFFTALNVLLFWDFHKSVGSSFIPRGMRKTLPNTIWVEADGTQIHVLSADKDRVLFRYTHIAGRPLSSDVYADSSLPWRVFSHYFRPIV